MITAVSAVTVSIVTSMAAMGLTAVFSLGAGALLVALLVTKQLVLVSENGVTARIGKFATVGIIPLLFGFGIITVVKLVQIML